MNILNAPDPDFMQEEEITLFSDSVGKWIDEHAPPEKVQEWIANSSVPRELWTQAGEAGLLGLSMPEEDGGMGGDYRHEVVLMRQLGWKGADHFGISLHNAIVAPYIWHYGTDEQKARWLPKLASGELVGAIAMTEPGAGSDLQGVKTTAIKQGNQYVVNGSKTFITNGQLANFIIVVAKTDPSEGAKGTSLIVVETDGAEGFERGRNLHKIGMEGNDTSELFFNDVKVPKANVLGDPAMGFVYLMQGLAEERLIGACGFIAGAQKAFEVTRDFVMERKVFGKPLSYMQNTQFKMAELRTEIDVAQAHVDACVTAHNLGELSSEDAAKAKLYTSEVLCRMVDEGVQLHGGAGYMDEYPISRMYTDARITRIFAGTSEVMKLIVGRDIFSEKFVPFTDR